MPDELIEQAQKLGGSVLAFALGILAFWFKANRTKSEVQEGDARVNILQTAIIERDKMAEKFNSALIELRGLAEDNARLQSENESLRESQRRMQTEIDGIRRNMNVLRAFIRDKFPGVPDEAINTGSAPLS